MADSSAERSSRSRVLQAFVVQGFAGSLLVVLLTILEASETARIVRQLGGSAVTLIAIFFFTSVILQLLRFELIGEISVSLEITAYIAMVPLLGTVISAWVAVLAPALARFISMRQLGPAKIDMGDPTLQWVRTFGLFGTFGIPVCAAGTVYGRLATFPAIHADRQTIVAIGFSGVVLFLTNNLVMTRVARAYGYSFRQILGFDLIDCSIYTMTLPYSVCMALSFAVMGSPAVLALSAELIVAYAVTRKMAIARTASKQMLQRLGSLTNIGRTISLTTTEDLLRTIYEECAKVVDTTVFSIALLHESGGGLSLALFIVNGERKPKQEIPAGQGLNAWVIEKHRPLRLGHAGEEFDFGLSSVEDGLATESWLGVPMIARDRVVGAISVQSYRRNAFSADDVLLLTTVANQAAVAIDHARLYEDLENLTYDLESRVQQRTNELRSTNVRLLEADRIKNEFLAKMSHELRTPLNSIIGFSSILLRDASKVIPPRLFRFVENIHAAGHHLLDLINDILDLSKIEAGKMELRLDDFDLRETIASVERVMRGFASEARVSIMSSVDLDVPTVRLDEGRLKQILFNLLSNAVKFSPEGAMVHMNVRRLAADQSPLHTDSVRIDVVDQGIGIPETELDRVFDEFYQGSVAGVAKKGTGLGLSLTRNFVELHHGTIEVSSSPEKGAIFTLFLPVDSDSAGKALVNSPFIFGAHLQ